MNAASRHQTADQDSTGSHSRRPLTAAGLTVKMILLLCGTFMLAFGLWALLQPVAFADFIDFPPYNEHLLHDLGAFQLALATSLLTAMFSSDAASVALLGLIVSGTIHTINHVIDTNLGGHLTDAVGLSGLALLAVVGLLMRRRQTSRDRSSRAGGASR